MKIMLEKVRMEVEKLLENENSGHGMGHINRVLNLSLKFAEKENANLEITMNAIRSDEIRGEIQPLFSANGDY